MNDRDERSVEYRYITSCCWPIDSHGGASSFWGLALLALGGVWLIADVVGYHDWGRWVVPALLVAWGIALLLGSRSTPSSSRH